MLTAIAAIGVVVFAIVVGFVAGFAAGAFSTPE
jgi:hypothetical protein